MCHWDLGTIGIDSDRLVSSLLHDVSLPRNPAFTNPVVNSEQLAQLSIKCMEKGP